MAQRDAHVCIMLVAHKDCKVLSSSYWLNAEERLQKYVAGFTNRKVPAIQNWLESKQSKQLLIHLPAFSYIHVEFQLERESWSKRLFVTPVSLEHYVLMLNPRQFQTNKCEYVLMPASCNLIKQPFDWKRMVKYPEPLRLCYIHLW